MVKNPTQINYKLLINCSFYGGEEYENLILNNNEMLKLIIENESDINISVVSSEKMLAEWVKKNFILYRLFIDLKEIFKIKNIF